MNSPNILASALLKIQATAEGFIQAETNHTPSFQQQSNRALPNRVMVEHDGVTRSLSQWAEFYGVDLKRLWNRLYRYKMPVALAFSIAPKNQPLTTSTPSSSSSVDSSTVLV